MAASGGWDANDAVAQLYAAHYQALVRLAALLVRHSGEAEEIVQDSFVAMHGRWHRLREPDVQLRSFAVTRRGRDSWAPLAVVLRRIAGATIS